MIDNLLNDICNIPIGPEDVLSSQKRSVVASGNHIRPR